MLLKGLDVSHFQGQPDFDVLKTNTNFVIIQSSFGDGYIDPQFQRNRSEARRVQIPCGFYHYGYPQYNSPEAEASWFLKTLGQVQENEILFLDLEEQYADPVGWAKKFLDYVSSQLNGYKPLLYTFDAYIKAHGDWSPIYNANYGLWYANYNGESPENPTWNTPWPIVPFWQYTSGGQIPGVSGNVDLDVFYGDMNAFNAYGYHKLQPTPQPTDPCRQALIKAHDIIYSNAFSWTKINQLKNLIPQ